MQKTNKTILFLIVFLASFSRLSRADVGISPVHPHGGSIEPSNPNTKVSMEYEEVTLTYGPPEEKYEGDYLVGEIMPVSVKAKFVMKNTSGKDEKLKVYFPQSDYAFVGGWSEQKIKNFKVNGTLIDEAKSTQIPFNDQNFKEITVYEWEEVFEANTTKEILITYETESQQKYQIFPLTYVLGTGKSWYGPIVKGVITFVMPYELKSYSVTSSVPMLNKYYFPYSVNENKITVSFSNYEPKEKDAIVLGVYDFKTVNEIENIKKLSTNLENTLKLAENFKKLTVGPKCSLCSGETTLTSALRYYNEALNLAETKPDLDKVLFSYSGIPGEYSFGIDDLLRYLSLSDCDQNDLTCLYDIYESREKMGATIFRLNWVSKNLDHQNFLLMYAKKIEKWNPQLAKEIRTYVSRAPEIIAYAENLNNQLENQNPYQGENPKENEGISLKEDRIMFNEPVEQTPFENETIMKDAVIGRSKWELITSFPFIRSLAPFIIISLIIVIVLFKYIRVKKEQTSDIHKNTPFKEKEEIDGKTRL